jgi:type III secretion system YscQ/HrcQ family protein
MNRPPGLLSGLKLGVSLQVAQFSLLLSDLRSLRVGDSVVFGGDRQVDLEAPDVWVAVGRGGFRGRLVLSEAESGQSAGVELIESFRKGGPAVNGDGDTETSVGVEGAAEPTVAAVSTLADSLEVEVVVELGRVELPATELMQLGVGDVITLQKPLVGAVDLRVGGKVIGKAELVDVDGEAGVRLLEIYGE